MEYRLDKRSGDELSAHGMGCMRLPRKGAAIDTQLSELIILEAFERGINYCSKSIAIDKEVLPHCLVGFKPVGKTPFFDFFWTCQIHFAASTTLSITLM
jgi:hypothetical protein